MTPRDEAASKVLVLDFGGQYAQLIARRVRECRVYSELIPHDTPLARIREAAPAGIILSGGPRSVNEPGAPALDPGILELGVPVLGICYGLQLLARHDGGRVTKTDQAEYGATDVSVVAPSPLFADLPAEQPSWMSHADAVLEAPPRLHRHGPQPDTSRGGHGGPRASPLRGAVPPGGASHQARPGGAEELPVRRVRHRPHVDPGVDHRGSRGAHPEPGRRREEWCAVCPAGSIRRSPRCSPTRRWAIVSPASSWTTA